LNDVPNGSISAASLHGQGVTLVLRRLKGSLEVAGCPALGCVEQCCRWIWFSGRNMCWGTKVQQKWQSDKSAQV